MSCGEFSEEDGDHLGHRPKPVKYSAFVTTSAIPSNKVKLFLVPLICMCLTIALVPIVAV
jgi:hypothetical protein